MWDETRLARVTEPVDPDRLRPLRIVAALLLLQSVGLAAISLWLAGALGPPPSTEAIAAASSELIGTVPASLFFAALSVVSLLAGIGFFLLIRPGWLLAIVVQGLLLLFTLSLYFAGRRPAFVFPTMIYSVVMVLYLNSFGIQSVFGPGRNSRLPEALDEP